MFVYYMLELFMDYYELVLEEVELDVLVKGVDVVVVFREVGELMFLVIFVEWLDVRDVVMEDLWMFLLVCFFWNFLVLF